jgi:hypothetical protein
MSQIQGGAGLGLKPPQYAYPSELNQAAPDVASAYIGFAAGDALPVPAGQQFIEPGSYMFLQYLDPINGAWRGHNTARGADGGMLWSDGVNYRISNLTGCPVAAVVTAGGSGYVQSSTTCAASTGGSLWQPIVGGMVSMSTISVAGSGYGIAPLLFIQEPPFPGVQATGHCAITGGSVTSVVLDNVGAGYITAPSAVIIPSPYDPNLPTLPVQAAATLALVGSGSISAVICTNNGAPTGATAPTLTISGAGTGASITAVQCLTITAGSVAAGGAGFTGGGGAVTVGGITTAVPQWVNPAIQLTGAIPRPAQIGFFATGGSLISVSTIFDGGLFFGTPTVLVTAGAGNLQTTTGSVTVTLGSTNDTARIVPM